MENNTPFAIHLATSPEETIKIATIFAHSLKSGDVVALYGDLGAGKTTFVKGVLKALCNLQMDEVGSPTFTYVHTYHTNTLTLHHFDLYRIESTGEVIQMGFEDYLGADTICLIEWPEIALPLLPKNTIGVQLLHTGMNIREIHIAKTLKELIEGGTNCESKSHES